MTSPKLRFVGLAFLTMVILACSLAPGQDTVPEEPSGSSAILNVSAEAQPGAVHVTVKYRRGTEATATLICTYPGPDGASRQYTYVDDRSVSADDGEDRTDSFDFVLTGPGQYSVTCQIGSSQQGANFKIDAPAAPDGPTSIPGTASQFKSGLMWLAFDEATSSVDKYYISHCLPGVDYTGANGPNYFRVAADGTLTGECNTADGVFETLTGKLTQGQLTADGQVTFRFATSRFTSVGKETSSTEIVWIGTGQLTGPTSASGTATWSGTCQTSSPDLSPCGKPEDGLAVDADGAIPWEIEFYP